jgi:hypothetical protein
MCNFWTSLDKCTLEYISIKTTKNTMERFVHLISNRRFFSEYCKLENTDGAGKLEDITML